MRVASRRTGRRHREPTGLDFLLPSALWPFQLADAADRIERQARPRLATVALYLQLIQATIETLINRATAAPAGQSLHAD